MEKEQYRSMPRKRLPRRMSIIHDLILADRRLKVREIAKTEGILKDRVGPYPAQSIGHEKAVGAMGAAFAYSG
ncbi:unnamed protein product [Pieris macdunnoughi]|uniref:Uncharacterized protein n=1 Tax=Pieris macdunnoughi TaxID=345717 RepID=A0A821L8W8_9NEOP|nr:unnamed protein product [Pieris macdunnoughi]